MSRTEHAIARNAFNTVIWAEAAITDNAWTEVIFAGKIATVVTFLNVHLTVILLVGGTHMEMFVTMELPTHVTSSSTEGARYIPIRCAGFSVGSAN